MALRGSAFALYAVRVTVLFAGNLGAVTDEETGVAGELVFLLGNDRNDEFLGHEFAAWYLVAFKCIGLVQLTYNTASVRSVGRLKGLK
jgi:hypothetical protein